MFAAMAIFFTGCSDSDDDDGEDVDDYSGATEFTVSVATPSATTKYFLFSAGLADANEKSSDKASTGWDIAFTNGRLILTNSGDTAATESSSGVGGVWYTGWTTFKNLTTLPAEADFNQPYATDTTKYVNAMSEGPWPVSGTTTANLNKITYIGYGQGAGTASDNFFDYQYNADQFYTADLATMPPVYNATKRVYIIRHGDGSGYTELQITSMEGGTSGAPRVYTGYYQTIP
jgi:hypothetical protein